MKILMIGDVVGSPGRNAVRGLVPRLVKERAVDFVIANAENAAGGTGITPRVANDLFQSGCHVLTAGDHIWRRQEVIEILQENPRLIRPLNLPDACPGKGYGIYTVTNNVSIAVVSLLGTVFVDSMASSAFVAVQAVLDELRRQTSIIVVDFHAEATSEKVAMGWFLDGRVSCMYGSHTHVQTADERILPNGTAYLTDLGMTGPHDSVIGRKKEKIIERFLTGMPIRLELGTDNVRMQGMVVDIDEKTGKARTIERVNEPL